MAAFRSQELNAPPLRPLPTAERGRVRGSSMRIWGRRHALCALPILLILALLPGTAMGQGLINGVSGYLEFDYSFLSTKTKDATGAVTKTVTNTYDPRFSLNIDTLIFPNLRLNAGGYFEDDISNSKSNGTRTNTTTTDIRPFFNLTLSDPLYTAGIGYIRRQEAVTTSGSPGVTTVDEDYNAILGWRPDGFPSINLQLDRTNIFDTKHVVENTTTDLMTLSSKYAYQGLDITYIGTYTDTEDKLNHFETTDLFQNGRITYTNSFFDRRVSLNSTYNIIYDITKTQATGATVGGTVSSPLFPFAGLFLITDMPTTGALSPDPALIDGNLTVSAGINIGLAGSGPPPIPRNVGLDLLNATEVNEFYVWVDIDLSSAPAIANSFSWDIYTSLDNLNWTFSTTVPFAPFGPFQNRFDINFPNVTTRYIKLVVKPLSAIVPGASAFPNINVTELQAFLKQPASQVVTGPSAKQTTITQISNTDVRARILNIPALYYDASFFFNRSDPSGVETYTLSNGLDVNHRFSDIFSGNARVAIENGTQENQSMIAYLYNASIIATPLRTLRDTLVFSGQNERIGGKPDDNTSLFLNNTATLYKGIDLNLNGGINFSTAETGVKSTNTLFLVGVAIVPYRTMNLSLDFVNNATDQSGGGIPASSTYQRREDVSISYTPFNTLHLFASVQILAQNGQKLQINQNYALNWSPFPDGALQFNITYNETHNSLQNTEDRTFIPSVRWYITTRSYLDLSYQLIKSSSKSQTSNSDGVFATLRIPF